MNRYEVIIYWSEDDGRYIAEVPELPGCMADGETRMEVLNNVETIISEWLETANLEGREIPVPKGKLAYAQQGESVGLSLGFCLTDILKVNPA